MEDPRKPFHFKQFKIYHDRCSMKVGTDGVLLGAWTDISNASRALDVGTGTGLIAIMLAQRSNLNITVDAIDTDLNAFQQAKENVMNCAWNDQIRLFHSSLQEYSESTNEKYNLIVSNPPFFNSGTRSVISGRDTARNTASLSHEELIVAVSKLLNNDGKFALILPFNEGTAFIELAKNKGLYCQKLVSIRPKVGKNIERLLMAFSFDKAEIEKSELVIQYEKRNDYTKEYIALTRDFYTIMD